MAVAKFSDYERYFEREHIHKFTPVQVGFVNPSPYQEKCHGCRHWFINQVSGWTPCEIMRLPRSQPVPGSGTCRFQTKDGKHYPLLNVL